jgi:hypothetical protein
VTCPKCGQAAAFHGHRAFRPVSLLGPVTCRRACYYCGRCGVGLCPFDQQAGFNAHRLTAGAERVVCLLGQACDSFEEAAKKALPEACGLRPGESTVQHTTEDAGKRLGEMLEQGCTLGGPAQFDWHKDATGRTCAYVGIEPLAVLKGLGVPRRQAVRAAYAEALMYFTNHSGRMDYPFYLSQGWHIGSGPVESGCKTVIGQRMKGGGMRWGEDGADSVAHLRALSRSERGQWEAFWSRN